MENRPRQEQFSPNCTHSANNYMDVIYSVIEQVARVAEIDIFPVFVILKVLLCILIPSPAGRNSPCITCQLQANVVVDM